MLLACDVVSFGRLFGVVMNGRDASLADVLVMSRLPNLWCRPFALCERKALLDARGHGLMDLADLA